MRKHVVIYGTNFAAQIAAINFGRSGYSVLLLNKGRFIGENPHLFLATSSNNVFAPFIINTLNYIPNLEIWNKVEIDSITSGENGVKVALKRRLPFVDTKKCIACQKCVGKGVKFVRRGVYLRDDGTLEDEKELESLCPVGAINTKEEVVTEEVEGDVFLIGTEFELSGKELSKYGYGSIQNVITVKEAKQMIFKSWVMGSPIKKKDGSFMDKIALLVPYTLESDGYLSNYNLVSAIQTAIEFKKLRPSMDITIFYALPNLYGKGNVAFLQDAIERGIKVEKIDSVKVEDGPKVNGEEFDLVVLGPLEKAPSELKSLAEKLNLKMLDSGYVWTSDDSLKTNVDRVFVVGEAHSAKPPLDSFYDGLSVVVESVEYLSSPLKMEFPNMVFPDYDNVDNPNIGLLICRCGAEHQGINADELAEKEKEYFKDVKVVDYACREDGQEEIVAFIKSNNLHRVVIGACSPFLRQPVIMQSVAKAGLDPVYADVAQLKEFGKSLEVQERLIAFSKKKVIDRKKWPMPVEDYDSTTLIVGTSTAALSAALSIQRSGLPVIIVSEDKIIPETPMQERLLNKLKDKDNVRILENVYINGLEGYAGHFVLNFTQGENAEKVYSEKGGAILFAPSVKVELSPKDFVGKEHIGIICGLVKANSTSTARTTCNKAISLAEEILEKGKKVTIGMPVSCINGENQDKIKVLLKKGLELEFYDPMFSDEDIVSRLKDKGTDSVVKIDANTQKAARLAKKLGFEVDPDGLLNSLDGPYGEARMKLRPHALGSKGVFVAGYMHKPMTEDEEIKDGEAQAYNILQLVTRGKMTPDPEVGRFVSYTNYKKCAGCALCVSACDYGARFIDPEEKVAKVREILCDGCAACVNACPSGAAQVRSLETKTMMEIINESVK